MGKATAQQKNDTAKFPNETAEVTGGTSAGDVIDGIGKALSDASRKGGG